MKIVVAQLGARMHYAVPRIFHEAGLLERFYTDSYIGDKPLLGRALRLIPPGLRPAAVSRLMGRADPCIPPEKVVSFDLLGLRGLWAQRRASDAAELGRVFAHAGKHFCEAVIAARPPEAECVWGFGGAALELFRWAKPRGMRCILEQTIAPARVLSRLLTEELRRWPGWEPRLELASGPDPFAEREEEEWALADRIITGSAFVADAIRECGGPAHNCAIVPYGVDTERFSAAVPNYEPVLAGRLRVLFAGEVGLRKGAPYLLEALRQLGPERVEGRFAGVVAAAPDKLLSYRDVATFLGPVPRVQMPAMYRWADVLVLPSICEGSATVVYEALAAGVYVITTPNAGPVLRGTSPFGEVVPIRDIGAIATALDRRCGIGPDPKRDRSGSPLVDLQGYRDRLLSAVWGAL